MEEVVNKKYHILKTSDNFYLYKTDIKSWIASMREDIPWLTRLSGREGTGEILEKLDQLEKGFDDIVYGGGGIMPDVFIPVDTSRYTDYHRSVVAAGLVNRIAMNYLDRHRAELNKKYPKFAQYKQNFNVTDDIMQELVTLAKDDKIEFNEEQYNRSKPLIMLQIKALIARDLYDMAEYFQVINDDNESFQEALRLINDEQRYKKELGR